MIDDKGPGKKVFWLMINKDSNSGYDVGHSTHLVVIHAREAHTTEISLLVLSVLCDYRAFETLAGSII